MVKINRLSRSIWTQILESSCLNPPEFSNEQTRSQLRQPRHRSGSTKMTFMVNYTFLNGGGEYMPNLHLQIHPVIIPITSRVIIWDFRLRISDLWNRYALSIKIDRIPYFDIRHSTFIIRPAPVLLELPHHSFHRRHNFTGMHHGCHGSDVS